MDVKCSIWHLCLCDFPLSASSAETPSLPQRIITAVKSYIYTPEEGKYLVRVSVCPAFRLFSQHCEISLFSFETAFRFPLKLAISGVVSFITLYQVMNTCTQSSVLLHYLGWNQLLVLLLLVPPLLLDVFHRQSVIKCWLHYPHFLSVHYSLQPKNI